MLMNMAVPLRLGHSKLFKSGLISGLCKLSQQKNVAKTQVAFITGKVMRQDRPPRPAPYDYMNKDYSFWDVFFDPMEERFDDNTKIVVVEGLPGVGKDKFARQLAEELEMCYMPPYSWDEFLITPYGFDMRNLNPKLPIDAQYFDLNMFLKDPKGRNSASIQHGYYMMKYRQYIRALQHLFSTGEGVILQRCPWSDMVFANAMFQSGYISRGGLTYYNSVRINSLYHLYRPHLVIYLDAQIQTIKNRIQRNGTPEEKSTKAFTTKYLSDIDKFYKEKYIPSISRHAHVLFYDWTEEGDMPTIVDEIQQLDFDNFDRETEKMDDWKFTTLDAQRAARDVFCNQAEALTHSTLVMRYDIPDVIVSGQDLEKHHLVLKKHQDTEGGIQYAPGYDPELDKGVLFKTKEEYKIR
ncbi:Similar to ND-42: NADH dehydrogenase [ubiquinone] 1 alpha subcomplex subunit 10 [Cotesia congregata]|uniref:NADH dehydrogenase [ubiquinone] 1 alpha subcomplex subunit 10, mitochondrial n=1 Tax=Cotesia congregata TaxID=51543 RepID=A0A8J2HN71_COTCN|nr:Similar to ND-42: NADH dehydrogenase [ubiquinone] 1 alpha subcomplex subunit 10 [Cotesia congregata]